jgi:diaminopimelate epimerase
MTIKFTKMEGLGNDFMLIDATHQACEFTPKQIQQMGHRRYGVGFDQLLVIETSTQPGIDFNYRIFNADGSKAEQCGNGARCIGHYIFDQKLSSKEKLYIQAPKSILEIWIASDGQIVVSMDKPDFLPENLPLNLEHLFSLNADTHPKITSQPPFFIKLNNNTIVEGYIVNVGNPHFIILATPDYKKNIDDLGKGLNRHPCFPEGINVSLVDIINTHHISLMVYERGVGQTPACGSAACASAVIAIKQGWASSPVKVIQSGGDLQINWENENQPLLMQGPAKIIYRGEYFDS